MGISIPQLRTEVKGRLVMPDDPGYDEARTIFYGGFDRRPQLIVQAADATDVARVVALARDTGVELAVRSGFLTDEGAARIRQAYPGSSCGTDWSKSRPATTPPTCSTTTTTSR
jgi:hypothetical protein